ncbi:lysine 2,3-aminomutase related protein [Chloroherpeton thalassium ATCC 35110]|uniref:Lysine 2,3-aminomutase related protein n=1 Tax=Chloroherpeton thalassium (strain ATCC 35110 / GB-78) TaxID=517418 RepID=B3QZ16_CHLT3|nr:4Fe-4S cluster-binding domain-containing protein [Chloroherpeton thalassium]ACF13709.1 lysine 2,3-aminomutase related protein [Chloroherpeton thalassium ATCC 35110]
MQKCDITNLPDAEFSFIPENAPKFATYTLKNFRNIQQLKHLPEDVVSAIAVVGHVFPFKVNSYVTEKLIDWGNAPNDPIFTLTFPQKGMLLPHHYEIVQALLAENAPKSKLAKAINQIREELNPHPAGQLEFNVPKLNGQKIDGLQHKYNETALFFPSEGQSCHAYCTYCFRWPQFGENDDLKIATNQIENVIAYLKHHTEISDVLITGGDPLTMSAKSLSKYVLALLSEDLPHIRTIRIGTKTLTYWPYRFLTEKDSEQLLDAFRMIVRSGKHLALMTHFNHPVELETPEVAEAIQRIRETGAVIRTQSPIIRGINDDAKIWSALWKRQVSLGLVPYYMFIPRDTGAQHFFRISLVRAWEIFKEAYQHVSGICRTVRGPSMSTNPGKVQVMGVCEVNGQKVISLQFLQGRNPDWVLRPFFAEFSESAFWLSELSPAFGQESFFYEEELAELTKPIEDDCLEAVC